MNGLFIIQVYVLGILLVVGAAVYMVAARSVCLDRESEESAAEAHPSLAKRL